MGRLFVYETSGSYQEYHKLSVRMHRDQENFHPVVYDLDVVQFVLDVRNLENNEFFFEFPSLLYVLSSLTVLNCFYSLQGQDVIVSHYCLGKMIQSCSVSSVI